MIASLFHQTGGQGLTGRQWRWINLRVLSYGKRRETHDDHLGGWVELGYAGGFGCPSSEKIKKLLREFCVTLWAGGDAALAASHTGHQREVLD